MSLSLENVAPLDTTPQTDGMPRGSRPAETVIDRVTQGPLELEAQGETFWDLVNSYGPGNVLPVPASEAVARQYGRDPQDAVAWLVRIPGVLAESGAPEA